MGSPGGGCPSNGLLKVAITRSLKVLSKFLESVTTTISVKFPEDKGNIALFSSGVSLHALSSSVKIIKVLVICFKLNLLSSIYLQPLIWVN